MGKLVLIFIFAVLPYSTASADPLFQDGIVQKLGTEYEHRCSGPCTLTIDGGKFDISLMKLSPYGNIGVLVIDRTAQAGSAGPPQLIMRNEHGKWRKIEESFSATPLPTMTNHFFDLQGKSVRWIWNGNEYVDETSYSNKSRSAPLVQEARHPTAVEKMPKDGLSGADCKQFFKGQPFIDSAGDNQTRVTFTPGGKEIREPLSPRGPRLELTWGRTADGFCGALPGSNEICYRVVKLDEGRCVAYYKNARLGTWALAPGAALSHSSANSAVPPPVSLPMLSINCSAWAHTPDGLRNIIALDLTVNGPMGDGNINVMLLGVNAQVTERCGRPQPDPNMLLDHIVANKLPRVLTVTLHPAGGVAGYLVTATLNEPGNGIWSIQKSPNAAMQAVFAANEAAARRNVRDTFVSQNGVEEFVNMGQLQQNPFPYKGKVIAVEVNFHQMIDADVALFDNGGGPPTLYVRNMPSVRNGGAVVLAIRITGRKKRPAYTRGNVRRSTLVCSASSNECSLFRDAVRNENRAPLG